MSVMGKEASLEGLEFDGETVLCRVCGDKASGFHYGVHACEGCKGFFRRSIQQKIQYRPCLKNQQCNIMRVNRNRCQYCRLKKCISVGMSRDAVRFGRVPKKEKARIIEQMQKVNAQSQTMALFNILQSELDVIQSVINAHRITCDFPIARVQQMRESALQTGEFVNCPAHMACPLNNQLCMEASSNKNDWIDYSESFTPAIKSVVDFARGIPGFILLNQDDQVTLLKAGTFEVLLVRLAILFDPDTNTMMFTGGKLFKRHTSPMPSGAGFLLDSMFDFADCLNCMNLTDDELGLFSAIVLLSPDRPGLRNVEQTERIQNRLTEALQNMINANHKEDSTLFAKLLMKTTDLRTLNTLHSEKSIAGQNNTRLSHERRERVSTDELDMEFQDAQSMRSGRSSSPSPSEASNITMTSGFSDAASIDSNGTAVASQRLPFEAAAHQQVVLRTPYGTFYREEMSGFYAMIPDQPRRRCNTLDRDTLSRPRLHTIEEGNRRRYTLDREYINKMVNKLSDRLEKRTAIHGDSVPTSISNSAASSPIQEEKYQYLNNSREFVPISRSDSIISSSRGSPVADGLHIPFGSSAASPGPRSRSGSFGQDDCQMRPRCYSFHLNSEGHASRVSLPHRQMMSDRDQMSPEAQQYLSPEMRRGSVGASYGLHARKKSLLVDRHPSYLNVNPELMRHEAEKRLAHNQEVAKLQRMVQEQSLYNRHSLYPSATATISSVPSPPNLTCITAQDNSPSKSPQQPEAMMPILSIAGAANQSVASGNRSGDISPEDSKSSDDDGQEIFHKKFDKMRKHVVHADDADSGDGGDGTLVVDEDSCNAMETGMDGESYMSRKEKSELLAIMQRTPGEAHPNLLAHLKSPAKIPAQPPSVPYPWTTVQGQKMLKEYSQEALTRMANSYQQSMQNPEHNSSLGQAIQRQADSRQVDQRQIDQRQVDQRQVDQRQVDQRQVDSRQMDSRQIDQRQMDSRQAELRQIDQRQLDSRQMDQRPTDSRQAELRQMEQRQADPRQSELRQMEQRQVDSRQSELRQMEQRQADSRQSELRQMEQRQADSRQMDQRQTDSRQIDSRQMDSRQMDQRQMDSRQLDQRQNEQRQVELKQALANAGNMGTKEQFHAAAVLHLKDKLLRKFDSMENLQKISKESSPQSDSKPQDPAIPKSCPATSCPVTSCPVTTCPAGYAGSQSLTSAVTQSAGAAFGSQGFQTSLYHSILASCPVSRTGAAVGNATTTTTTTYNSHITSKEQLAQVSSSESRSQTESASEKSVEQHHPLNLSTSKVEESRDVKPVLSSVASATSTALVSHNGFCLTPSIISSSNQTS